MVLIQYSRIGAAVVVIVIVGFTTTCAISTNHYVHGEVYSMQHYVIKFASDLQQVGDFRRQLRFPPPIKLTVTISLKYC